MTQMRRMTMLICLCMLPCVSRADVTGPTFPTLWTFGGVAIGQLEPASNALGAVLMSDIVAFPGGLHRLYFNRSSGQGDDHIAYAESTNGGLSWSYRGDLLNGSTNSTNAFYIIGGSRVLALSNGTYRMYLRCSPGYTPPETPVYRIYSALSSNGTQFTLEPGIRIPTAADDPSSPFSLAGHGAFFQLSNGAFAGIFSANLTNDAGASDLFYAESQDGLAWGNYRLLYEDFHDPVVFRHDGRYHFIAKYLAQAIYTGASSDGILWPTVNELDRLTFYDQTHTNVSASIGDVGAMRAPDGDIWIFSNWDLSRQAVSTALAFFTPGHLTPADYDADGQSDFAVYGTTPGSWYVYSATNAVLAWGAAWGGAGYATVPGDYDGDGRFDLSVQGQASGAWFVRALSGATQVWNVTWGGMGYAPVPGDYDGDGRHDYAVYGTNAGAWYVFSATNGVLVWGANWGGPGYQAVPGDADGDGRADFTLHHAADGLWYSLSASGETLVWGANWGGAGFTPLLGDFDGDRIADLAVYQIATGHWYIRTLTDAILAYGFAFGSANCDPVPGDYDGDGTTDLAVYERTTGIWYVRRSSDQTLGWLSWGGPGYQAVR